MDVSADLRELGNTPVSVICAGAKSILDLKRTLEYLETEGVPVLGYKTEEFPNFYTRKSGLKCSGSVSNAEEAGKIVIFRIRSKCKENSGSKMGSYSLCPYPKKRRPMD